MTHDSSRLFLHAWGTLCLALFLAVVPSDADAAGILTGKSDVPSVQQVCNPRPATGDIVLPMPGGLHMVLRAVCVPAAGYLDDVQQPFGVAVSGNDGEDSTQAWTECRYTSSVNAPFELSDLPVAWGQEVAELLRGESTGAVPNNALRLFFYVIGKYEVTRGQWRAVMEDANDFALRPGDDKPASNVSWFDVMQFNHRYSRWLMRHKAEYLPFFTQEQRSSFVRLPTEAEWEYAARGGHMVNAVERERTRLHPVPENADMGEYIIASLYDATLTGSVTIGTRKPNPLALHDMLGNCAEMVHTPFRLVANGRLLGNQGGFVIKGGSWRAHTETGLHPGRRVEASYYVDGEAQRRDDLGFRVSLGSILTPRDRQDLLLQEWQNRRAPHAANATPRQDVRIIIREVVREVEDPALRQRLAEAEETAARYHEQVNENEERMLREMLLGAAFSLETIANYAARCHQLIRLTDAYAALTPQEQRTRQEKMEAMRRDIQGFIVGIQGVLHYYRHMMRTVSAMDATRLEKHLASVRTQFVHDDGFSRNIAKRLGVLQTHAISPQVPTFSRDDLDVLQDILPRTVMENLRKYWKM